MAKVPLNAWGLKVKARLCELGETQQWLCRQVAERTGKYFDNSYLFRLMTGRSNHAGMKEAAEGVLWPEQGASPLL